MAKIYGRLSGEGGVRERVRLKVRRERRCLKWRGLNRVGRMGGQSPRQYLSLPHCPRLLSSDSLRMSQGCSKITLLEDSPPRLAEERVLDEHIYYEYKKQWPVAEAGLSAEKGSGDTDHGELVV